MGSSENQENPDEVVNNTFHHSSPSSSRHDWKSRIFIQTLLAGVVGAGTGLILKHRKRLGLADVSAYAANYAIMTGCYCGAHEIVTATRKTGPENLWNSVIAGFGSGALLGSLYGGQFGATCCSIIFAVVGTTADFTILKLKDGWRIYQDIKKIIAEKQAQEEQFLAQRARIRSLRDKEDS